MIVALGAFGWDAAVRTIARHTPGATTAAATVRPRFGHGAEARLGRYVLLGTYHPSQQNTFTGRLTADMLDAVLARAVEIAGRGTT